MEIKTRKFVFPLSIIMVITFALTLKVFCPNYLPAYLYRKFRQKVMLLVWELGFLFCRVYVHYRIRQKQLSGEYDVNDKGIN